MTWYCTDKECEKYKQGHCQAPKGPSTPECTEIKNCSCKECEYDFTLPPCEFVGDMYNTDGDCLAQKMKCHNCGRELIEVEDGLYCKPEWDHTHTFQLTQNKTGCGAFYSKASWIRYDVLKKIVHPVL